ncbi:MAG: MFS transporter [Polyangiaceae bacterium]
MSDAGVAPPTTRGSPLLPLFMTVLVDVLALSIMLPLLPFMATRYGASPFVADLLFASFSACQFISGPFLGWISDRVGRKPTLVVSQLGTFAGLLVLAFANRIELLFVARMIDGLTAGNLSIAQAYITDVTRPENRTRAYGLIGLAFGIGFLIGPAASGWLAQRFDYGVPPLVAAGLSLLSVVLTVTLLPANKPKHFGPRPSRAELLRRYFAAGETRGRLLEMFAFVWSFSTLTSGLALVLHARMGYEIREVAYCFAYTAIVGGSITGALKRASARFGEHRLSLAGLGLMFAGSVLLAYADNLGLLLVALGVGSLGSSVVRPALTTMLTSTVPEHEHGLALGISQALNSIALTLAPILGGLLITGGDYGLWAVDAAAFAALAIALRFVTGTEKKTSESRGPRMAE